MTATAVVRTPGAGQIVSGATRGPVYSYQNLMAPSTGPPAWVTLTDLANATTGGRVEFATDEWFAPADSLLQETEAVYDPNAYSPQGKLMDGWESRRKRTPGHDWCIIKLGLPGFIRGIELDTHHFTGNHAPAVSIQGACLDPEPQALVSLARAWEKDRVGSAASEEESRLAESVGSHQWGEVLPFTRLNPGYEETHMHYCPVQDTHVKYTHLRLNMFPDGGVARLRVRGIVSRDWAKVPPTELVDLLAVENGGQAVQCNNRHFGEPRNLIKPGRGIHMGDGWETARKPTRPAVLELGDNGLVKAPGSDWAVLSTGTIGTVQRLVIDTNHFKGNFPESVLVEGCLAPDARQDDFSDQLGGAGLQWTVVLPRTRLGPHQEHTFTVKDGALRDAGPLSHVRLSMFPDGGIMRVRAFGFRTTPEAGATARSRL